MNPMLSPQMELFKKGWTKRVLTWLEGSSDHVDWTLRAERDICTPVCRVRLYCLPLWKTETAKFLLVREIPRPLTKQKQILHTIYFCYIFKNYFIIISMANTIDIIETLTIQALFFILGVYL